MADFSPESDEEADLALVAASLLGSGRLIHAAALGLLIGAALIAVPIPGRAHPLAAALAGASIPFYFAGLYLAIRVAFDAALFRALGVRAFDLDRLDRALTRLRLLPAAKEKRPMEQRVSGAFRLMRWQAACLGAQFITLLAAAVFCFGTKGSP